MDGQPIQLADGMTHVVFAKRSGTLADRTACGIEWRRTGQWPSEAEPVEVDCMACVTEGTRE